MEREILSTNRKALRINLNPNIYGTFAEIGGGQEIARQFFQAGGASGTVAKTISAYDKSFSDSIYNKNKPGRYVSEQRLQKMLQAEYDELIRILDAKQGKTTRFFSFANTVETLNFKKTNQGQGWLGVIFQLSPRSEPNQVIIHVNLLENDSLLQQRTLGILGVNLMFACYFYHERPNQFIQSLQDNLTRDHLEITMIRMRGPDLEYVDNRLLAVQLVKNKMTPAIMFDRYGEVHSPADLLYKKNVLAFRGSFRPVTYVTFDMLQSSFRIFKRDADYDKSNTISLCEMTINKLLHQGGDIDERDFLDRVDVLNGMGQNVMVSTFREYYKLVGYFSQFKIINLRIVIGIPTFMNVLEKKYYLNLRGGILEALGKLFVDNMKLYIYPTVSAVSIDNPDEGKDLITTESLPLPDDLRMLVDYLYKQRKILDIKNVKKDKLYINSENVLRMIQEDEPGWERMVPRYIEEQIKTKKLFGYDGDGTLYRDSEEFTEECKK
jgi:hypothetical protein